MNKLLVLILSVTCFLCCSSADNQESKPSIVKEKVVKKEKNKDKKTISKKDQKKITEYESKLGLSIEKAKELVITETKYKTQRKKYVKDKLFTKKMRRKWKRNMKQEIAKLLGPDIYDKYSKLGK